MSFSSILIVVNEVYRAHSNRMGTDRCQVSSHCLYA